MGRRQEQTTESPTHDNGCRIFTVTSGVNGRGRVVPQEPTPMTGDPASCPGEALLWQS